MNSSRSNKLLFLLFCFFCLLFSLKSTATTPGTVVTNLRVGPFDNRLSLGWDASSNPGQYLIIINEGAAETTLPQNGVSYSRGDSFGNGEVFIVAPGQVTAVTFDKDRFLPGRHYFITIYPFNGTGSNTMYKTTDAPTTDYVNPGVVPNEPPAQPTNFSATVGDVIDGNRIIRFSFDKIAEEASSPYETRYLIIFRTDDVVNFIPSDGATEVTSSFNYLNIGGGQFAKLNRITGEEAFRIPASSNDQEIFFKIYAFNRARSSFSPTFTDQRNSANYLTTDPLSMTVFVPAEEENTPPTFNNSTFSINENPLPDTKVGDLDVNDNQSGPLSLSIVSGNTGDAFYVNDEQAALFVSSDADIDFETTPVYEMVIRATDNEGLTADATITVNLQNTNDNSPTFGNFSFSIPEGSPVGTLVGQVSATDADGDDITFSITAGNTTNAFAIDENSGDITVNDLSPLDFDVNPEFNLSINASDGLNETTGFVTIALEEEIVTGPPSISPQTFTIFENSATGTTVGSVSATDPDNDPITFAIVGGNEQNAFSIDENSGLITVSERDNLDFAVDEFVDITVSASDQTGSNSSVITVILNQNFQFSLPAEPLAFDENSFWTVTIPYSDRESDEPESVVFESGNTDELLKIELFTETNEISISPANMESGIDFEAIASFDLLLSAKDLFENTTISETISIAISNLNDNIPEVSDAEIEINQGLENGTLVTTIMATDADNDVLNYSIESGNTADAFAIDTESGELTVNNSDALDFATNPTFVLTVLVSDGTFQTDATLTVSLLEEFRNSAPVIEMQSFTLIENSPANSVVGVVQATDVDEDALRFSIDAGNTNGAFTIGEGSGELIIANEEAIDFETTPQFNLIVSVSDGEFTETAVVTVIIIDEDEVVLSVDESIQSAITYPNPVVSYFSLKNNHPCHQVTIVNMAGKTIKTFEYQADNRYFVEGVIAPGIYKIITSNGKQIHSNTIIIE